MAVSALIVGIIGVSLDILYKDYSNVEFSEYSTECSWYGAWGIFCTPHCPAKFKPYRHETRESLQEHNYGTTCWAGSKVYCCSVDSNNDQTWGGSWNSVLDGSIITCHFHSNRVPANGDCGSISCTLKTYNPAITSSWKIRTDRAVVTKNPDTGECQQVKIFGAHGTALSGRINFSGKWSNRVIAIWIKTGL